MRTLCAEAYMHQYQQGNGASHTSPPASLARLVTVLPSSRTGCRGVSLRTTLQRGGCGVATRRHWIHYIENMTSSTKPEVYNVSQRCQRRTEPRLPIYMNVTKKYNSVLADWRWRYLAGKVTAGLTDNNGSLPPCGRLKATCGLTACTPG